jgi:hypothetical protein
MNFKILTLVSTVLADTRSLENGNEFEFHEASI